MSDVVESQRGVSVWAMGVPVAASCVIVSAKVVDLAGISSFAVVLVVAGILAGALAVVAGGLRPRSVSALRFKAWDALPLVTVAAVAVGLWARAFQRVLTTPVVFGVDPARHVSMTAWIVEHQGLVQRIEPQLGSLSNYPPGAHVLAAMATWVTGASPLATTWLVAVVATLCSLLLVAVMAGEVLPRRSPVPGVLALCLCVIAWRFTIGMVTYEFYFSQVVGLTLLLGGVLAVVAGLRAGDQWWRWVPLALVSGVASFLTYPQQALVIPAVIATGLWVLWRRNRSGFTARGVAILLGGVAAAGIVGLLVLRRSGYLSSGALFGSDDGFVTTLGLSRIGGWVPCMLVLWGTVVLVGLIREGVPGASVVLVGCAVPVGLAVGLWMLQHGIPVRVQITNYRIAKNVFTSVPFAAVIAGVGIGALPKPQWAQSRTVAALVAAITVMLPWQPRIMSNTRYPVVSHEAYDLARWAADHYDVTDIGVVGPDLEPFFLWIDGLRRPLDPDPGVALLPVSTHWADWPLGPEKEHLLLVSGRRSVARYRARPNVTLVRQQGDAALFKRTK